MEPHRQPLTTAFFLIQIILSITTSDMVVGLPRPSKRGSRSFQGQNYLSFGPERHQQQGKFSFMPDHRVHYGGTGRQLFGALNQRSTGSIPPDPDRYWDFVLGSGTFKRRGDYRTSEVDSTSGRGRVRRDVTSAGSRWPLFDVLGRKVKGKGQPNGDKSQTAACSDEKSAQSLQEVAKKTDEKTDASFFPSTSFGENHDFYDFLLGEHAGRR